MEIIKKTKQDQLPIVQHWQVSTTKKEIKGVMLCYNTDFGLFSTNYYPIDSFIEVLVPLTKGVKENIITITIPFAELIPADAYNVAIKLI